MSDVTYECVMALIDSSTAYCIWSVISSFSNLDGWSRSLGLFGQISLRLRLEIKIEWHFKCNSTLFDLDLLVFFAKFDWKETHEIEIGDWDGMTFQMQ